MIPTTEDAAIRYLEIDLGAPSDRAGRPIVISSWRRPEPDWEGRPALTDRSLRLIRVASPEELEAARLDHADGWIVPTAWLEDGRPPRFLPDGAEVRSRRVEPGWFRFRGPELIAASRPWTRAAAPAVTAGAELLVPADLGPRELISVELALDGLQKLEAPPELLAGGGSRPLHPVALNRGVQLLATGRFPAAPGQKLTAAVDPSWVRHSVLHRWRPPGQELPAGASSAPAETR